MAEVKFDGFEVNLVTIGLLLDIDVCHVLNIDHRVIFFGLHQLNLQIFMLFV